jgi:hypothetical protein
MSQLPAPLRTLAEQIARRYSELPQVEAVALAGSQTMRVADANSDIDLYVYVKKDIPQTSRARIASTNATDIELDNQFWEPGDEWRDRATGVQIDVMFRRVDWIEEQLARVLYHHQASIGYSTCIWHNVRSAQILYDQSGWFHTLHHTAQQNYPEGLRRAIIDKNYPVLRQTTCSYITQLQRAIERNDLVSVNHRTAALLASYFDVLFALNRLPHPGEKRMLAFAEERCTQAPLGMSRMIRDLIRAIPQRNHTIVQLADDLVEGLRHLLRAEGIEPPERIVKTVDT